MLRGGRSDRDLEEELRVHLELAQEEARRRGLDPSGARRDARLRSGGMAQALEALHDQRGLTWADDLVRDIQYGARSLRRTPVFTMVALLTLALGIGANTAIFSVVNGVLLNPLGYPRPEQLMLLTSAPAAGPLTALSYPEYEEFRKLNRSFAAIGAFTTGRTNTGGGSGSWTGEVNVTANDRPLRARSAAVDDHLLRALGVEPLQGRFFAPGETDAMRDRPGLGGPPLAILSHELWQRAFNGAPVVGATVVVDGRPHDVIGIMPPGVDLMDTQPEIWLPLGVHPAVRRIRNSHVVNVIGRLKDGVRPEMARTELGSLLENWGERVGADGHVPIVQPSRAEDHGLRLRPVRDAIVGDARRGIWVLQAAVGVVLLIACANLAHLVVARAGARRREFAVRAALGASRGRLFRQTLTEGLLLSIAGGLLGIWFARLGVEALAVTYPAALPRTGDVAIDMRVLLFAAGVSMGTGLLFGLAPVVPRRISDLVTALKEGAAGAAGRHRLRRALVTAEVALAVMLVTAAGLLVRTVYNLTQVDAGFDRSHLVTFSMTLPRGALEGDGRAQVYLRLLETLRALPGVQAATAMSNLPLNRVVQAYRTGVRAEIDATRATIETVDYYQFVMSDYFDTMGIPIVAGRAFEASDTLSEERVAIVNETLANRFWKGRNPIGQRLQANLSAAMGTSRNPWHTVIGVAKDVKEGGVDRQTGAELYLFTEQPAPPIDGTDRPWRASAPPTLHVALRTSLPPAALSQTLERLVREVDPSVPVVRLRHMEDVFAHSIRRSTLMAQLLALFGAMALLLASIGTYGVLSYMVTGRRREIGIRIALGAERSSVIALFMKQGLQLTIIGVLAGLAASVGAGRLLGALLFGVRPVDPATVAAVIATITLVATAASWLPAWRASRVDPNIVLRAE